MEYLFLVPYWITFVLFYTLPTIFIIICIWRAFKTESAAARVAWIIGAFAPFLLYYYNNTSADLEWSARQKKLIATERVSIKGRAFSSLVSFGWLGDEAQMILARRYGIRTFFIVEQNNIKLNENLDQNASIQARIFRFDASGKCGLYADYLVEKSKNWVRPPPPPPPPGTTVVVQFDVGEKQRKELVSVFVPLSNCLIQSSKTMKIADLSKSSLYISRIGVPSLSKSNLLRTERWEVRVYSGGMLKLVDAYEEEDTVRQKSPFCLPIFGSGMCETQQKPDKNRRSILEMIHSSLRGGNYYDGR